MGKWHVRDLNMTDLTQRLAQFFILSHCIYSVDVLKYVFGEFCFFFWIAFMEILNSETFARFLFTAMLEPKSFPPS